MLAVAVGGVVVAILVGFVVGPSFGIEPWMVAAAADGVLVLITRAFPWRSVPVLTAFGVAAVAAVAALVVPGHALTGFLHHPAPIALLGVGVVATAVADVINNLPAFAVRARRRAPHDLGRVGLAAGRQRGVGVRRYVGVTVPIALPALAAALMTLALERLVAG